MDNKYIFVGTVLILVMIMRLYFTSQGHCCVCVCVFRLDFNYLNDLPVLVLDVDTDFQSDRIKQEAIVQEVLHHSSRLFPVSLDPPNLDHFVLQVKEFVTTL